MKEYTPKQLTDMGYSDFMEVINQAVKNSGNVDSKLVRELRRRSDNFYGQVINAEQIINGIASEELEGRVSKTLQDQIFLECFKNASKEYDRPTMQEYAAVTEEAYQAQQLIISELRRYK